MHVSASERGPCLQMFCSVPQINDYKRKKLNFTGFRRLKRPKNEPAAILVKHFSAAILFVTYHISL
jgi:hypothetical protein